MTDEIDQLIKILSVHSAPVSLVELKDKLPAHIPERTLRRWLARLVSEGTVVASGQYKSRRYQLSSAYELPQEAEHIFFSPDSLQILKKIQRPIFQREPCTYNESWLKAYVPNQKFYLSPAQRDILAKNSLFLLAEKSADTYTKRIFDRLLIDLSYNSSRLEGNTYSLLDTQKLVIEGTSAPDKLDAEKLMILNHKEAIKFLVEGINRIGVNTDTIRTMHYLLADGLVLANKAGQVRDDAMRVSLTTYAPIEGKQRLAELLESIANIAAKIIDPFEQSFFLLVHISYLQAFIDVNKRTARLCANIPLVQKNLVPIAFSDIDKDDYISAIIAIYEYNQVEPLAELYTWSYLRSCKQYQTISEVIGIDTIHVRYRQLRRELMAKIIREKILGEAIQKIIQEVAKENVPEQDYVEFIRDVTNELENLEIFKIAGMGISQTEFIAWKNAYK